jgi:predicted metal-dependent hydrolase
VDPSPPGRARARAGAACSPRRDRALSRSSAGVGAEIEPRLARACAQAEVSYQRLAIRSQRTRWGSCSRSGTLSFNWRLLLAPEPVLDYVIWHEVCHLRIADHSPRFWALLEAHLPDYRQARRWLRANGATLVL